MQSSMLIPHVWLIKPLQPLFRLHTGRRCHFCYHATVGWGGAKTFMCTSTHRIGYIMMISSLALAQYWTHTHTFRVTLWYRRLHLHNLAKNTLDATFWYLLVHLPSLADTHTHTHSHLMHLDPMLWYLFWDRIYQWILQAQFGKVTTDRQHEKGMENVQIKLVVVKRYGSKHISHEVVKREAFLYIDIKNAGVRETVLSILIMFLVAFKSIEVRGTTMFVLW